MPRRLLVLNALLLAASFAAGVYIVIELREPHARPTPVRPRPASEPAAPPAAAPARTPAPAWSVIASRNLFSPTRSETPPAGATAGRPAPALPKPNLYGVVLRDGAPIAYLEDPATKRVGGYRLGDSIAGGTVKAINADHVVLARPEGQVDVRLRDPAKPRPVVQQAPPAMPGGVPPHPAATVPGVPVPPGGVVQQPPAVQQPGLQPGAVPSLPPIPPRRQLPPSLLRRVPPGSPSDATSQP